MLILIEIQFIIDYKEKKIINLKIKERKLGDSILKLLKLNIITKLDTKLLYKNEVGLNTTFFFKIIANTLPPNYFKINYIKKNPSKYSSDKICLTVIAITRLEEEEPQ